MKLSRHGAAAALALSLMIPAGWAQTKASAPPQAQSVIGTAVISAKAEGKNVLVHFGASWCSWCKRLDAMLDSPEVGKLFHESYVITHLTIQESDDKKALENPGAQEIADAAGAGKAGIPIYIFLDGNGKTLATSLAMPNGGNIGHPATPEEIKIFDDLLMRTAPHMTAAQRAQIVKYLENQKL
jgi:thiol-disulfide isomerase/thioredoxin